MRFKFIRDNRSSFAMKKMCQVFKVSPSGYYRWLKNPVSIRKSRNIKLQSKIKELFTEHRGMVGSPMITADLRAESEFSKVSKNRVAKLMKDMGLKCRATKKYIATTNSKHNYPVAPNLLNRKFVSHSPNKVWVSDITYFKVGSKWHYLAVFIDLYSRIVVGWDISSSLDRQSMINAFQKALMRRRPTEGLLIHSDRGVQYASTEFRNILKNHGITQSMSRKGNCWDTQFIIPMNVRRA